MQWLLGPFGSSRWSWPLPSSARTRAARRRLDAAIDGMVAERRARPREDLLSRLVEREPDDQVVQATFKQWLGADQLHALFTWTLHLLAGDGDVEARWHAELDDVLGDPRRDGRRRAGADLHAPGDQGVAAALSADLGLLPPGDRRLPARRGFDPQGHVIAMSQWGDAPRPRPVGRSPSDSTPSAGPTALRARPAVLLLPLLGRPVRVPRRRPGDDRGRSHPRHARPALGPAPGRRQRAAPDGDGHDRCRRAGCGWRRRGASGQAPRGRTAYVVTSGGASAGATRRLAAALEVHVGQQAVQRGRAATSSTCP